MGKRRDLFSQDLEYGIGRVAGFKSGQQWVRSEVILGLLLVRIQSGVEDGIKVETRGRGGVIEGHGGWY
jgi:hypothetical protein